MIEKFNDLPWHDSELKEIIINRENDTVKILIRWPEEFGAHFVIIEFINCYALHTNMHFGFVPPEFILDAECIDKSHELDDLKNKWNKMGLDISELRCYKLTTNSTNSFINIFALNFRVTNIASSAKPF